MRISTPAFHEAGTIPAKYTCDGENISPPLEWADVPAEAKTLALIMDDPDAPKGLFLHWLLYDIPVSEKGLTEGVGTVDATAGGGKQGRNGFGNVAYGGPCPPSGTHRYFLHLYALDAALGMPAGAGRQDVEKAMRGHVLGQADLMGRYARARR
jgi:Raf kinase inhibitor-like YbhB/YbcL family protein